MKLLLSILVLCIALAFAQFPPTIEVTGTLRDFVGNNHNSPGLTHPDFESFCCGVITGMVAPQIGPDNKPVLADPINPRYTNGGDFFNAWFRDTPFNAVPGSPGNYFTKPLTLVLNHIGNGIYQYENYEFFPADNWGYGNLSPGWHNYHFTFELHGSFLYMPSPTPQRLDFCGDDDVWLYINGQLIIDLGGVHPLACASFTLDDQTAAKLGLEPNRPATFDLFFAERHTTASNFKLTLSYIQLKSKCNH